MGVTIRTGPIAQVVNHLEVSKAEVTNYAGGLVVPRQKVQSTGGLTVGNIWVDRGYPFPVSGNLTSADAWQMYQTYEGTVLIGQMQFLVVEEVSGYYVVRAVFPMSQNQTGPGVWEHALSGTTAVTAGWYAGLWIYEAPYGAGGYVPGVTYDPLRDPESVDVGSAFAYFGPNAPIVNDQVAAVSNHVARRASFQIRGGTGSFSQITGTGQTKGSSGRTDLAGGHGTTYDIINESGGVLSNADNLFNENVFDSVAIPTGYSGEVVIRLVDGANTVGCAEIACGLSEVIKTVVPGMQGVVYTSADIAAADNGYAVVADWQQLFVWPDDDGGVASGETNQATRFHVGRDIRWIKLAITNNSGVNVYAHTFLPYTFTTAEAAGNFIMSSDGDDEWAWVEDKGVTLLLTQDAASSTDTLTFDNAGTEINTIDGGETIWLRKADGTRYKYTVDSVSAPDIVLTTNLNEDHTAGEFVDSCIHAFKVEAVDGSSNTLATSAALLAAGTFRERFISRKTDLS